MKKNLFRYFSYNYWYRRFLLSNLSNSIYKKNETLLIDLTKAVNTKRQKKMQRSSETPTDLRNRSESSAFRFAGLNPDFLPLRPLFTSRHIPRSEPRPSPPAPDSTEMNTQTGHRQVTDRLQTGYRQVTDRVQTGYRQGT